MKVQFRINCLPFPTADDLVNELNHLQLPIPFAIVEQTEKSLVIGGEYRVRMPKEEAALYLEDLAKDISEILSSSPYENWSCQFNGSMLTL